MKFHVKCSTRWQITNTHSKQKKCRGEAGFPHVGLSRQNDRPLVAPPGDSGPRWTIQLMGPWPPKVAATAWMRRCKNHNTVTSVAVNLIYALRAGDVAAILTCNDSLKPILFNPFDLYEYVEFISSWPSLIDRS